MKKIFLMLVLVLSFVSCTRQQRARHLGGDVSIFLDPGYKLVEATWKDENLWVLIEPMDSSYIPKVKIFKEYSDFGVLQGSINFVEKKETSK